MAAKKGKQIKEGGKLQTRAPIVAVLGHVDHGKTTLLSKIKEVDLTKQEYGGISQHIGAYQVRVKEQKSGRVKRITFIDTPGHAAFSQMRSRGASVADLVILAVAVNEGVKPQTLESLKHIQQANIPYLVALTKIDLPNINIKKIKEDLSKHGIMIEGYGGEIVVVPVSGKTGKGIKDLLEMILILGEMSELKGSLNNLLKGVVIESKLDSQKGPLATVLVQDGSLKVGDEIAVEGKVSKVKAMFDENGRKVFRAGPSAPVEVLGFKEVPPIGTKVEKKNKELLEEKPMKQPAERLGRRKIKKGEEEEKKFKIILKSDTVGTLEAITNSLPDEVLIIHSGVSEVNESDVLLAETTGAKIITFNVRASGVVKKLAETEKIEILSFKVIYRLLEEIEKKILKMLKPRGEEEILGEAEILKEFEIRKERIAGCRVTEGKIKKSDRFHLSRKGKIIGDCRAKSMKTGKRDIEKAEKGEEFGVIPSPPLDFRVGDVLVSFHKVEES